MTQLTKEIILTKCRVDTLEDVKNLSLWGNDLEDVSIIKQLPNVEVVSLSVNKITTLKPFASCKKLQELYLRKNLIPNLEDIKVLEGCKLLKILWLGENPCCETNNYRLTIIKVLPQLLKLDNIPVEETEREEATKTIAEYINRPRKRMQSIKDKKLKLENSTTEAQSTLKRPILIQEDYMTQFKDLNDVQQFFSTNGKVNDFSNSKGFKGYNDIFNRNARVQSSKYNSPNIHLIKAVINLLEELDISQLHYIKRYVDKRLGNI